MKTDLTKGSVDRHLIRMSVPMAWGIFAIMTMNIVDSYFVAQLGTEQLAVMGFVAPVMLLFFGLAWGIATGASSVISRAIGATNDMGKIKNYVTQALILAFIIGIVFAVIGFLTMDIFFPLLGVEPDLMLYIHNYMDIWYMGCFLVVVQMVGSSMMRSVGNAKFPGYIMLLMSVVNIILDPILIFGLFGFPEMGLQGAALATVIAYLFAFWAAIYILSKKMQLISWVHCYDRILQHWKGILYIGIPATGANLIVPLSMMITTWLVAQYGTEAVAGYGVASRIEGICFVFIYSVISVTGPIVGQNWGAKKFERVKRLIFIGYRFSIIWGIISAILLWVLAKPIVLMFDENQQVIESAVFYLYIIPLTYIFLGIILIASSVANGIGTPKPAFVLTFSRLIVVYLPLAFLLSYLWDLKGLYIATALANIIVGTAALLWTRNIVQKI